MKQANTIIAVCTLSMFCSCDPEPDTRYMYIQPESVVYNLNTGAVIDNSEVGINDLEVYVKTPYSQQTVFQPSALPFVTKSYAMYKKTGRALSVEKVTKLRVLTLKDYDATHPAGSDITDLCLFYTAKTNTDTNKANPVYGDTISVNRIVKEMNVTDVNSDFGYPGLRKDFLFIMKNTFPSTSVKQFKIEFETATPSKFSTTTKPFILKP